MTINARINLRSLTHARKVLHETSAWKDAAKHNHSHFNNETPEYKASQELVSTMMATPEYKAYEKEFNNYHRKLHTRRFKMKSNLIEIKR